MTPSPTWNSPTVLVPLIVSLVALGGVVFSTLFTAWRNRVAEDQRAKTTIEAEDRRARAAIDAENLRHEHALEAERRRHVLTTRHDFYLELSASTEALNSALAELEIALDEQNPPDESFSDQLSEVVGRFSRTHDQATLYASTGVRDAGRKVYFAAVAVEQSLWEPWPDAAGDARSLIEATRSAAAHLTKLLRQEVGADD